MKFLNFNIERIKRSKPEVREVPQSAEHFFAQLGFQDYVLENVTTDQALTVPAVAAAVAFLPRTLAALPLHAFNKTSGGPKKAVGAVQTMVHFAPNPQMDGFKFRQYFWQQVFTGGRGLAWIERVGGKPVAIWPMNPNKTTIRRKGWELLYKYDKRTLSSADVIDIPFMLKSDLTGHYGPIKLATKAIQLALAMGEYGSKFFAGGGVPPLVMSGTLPEGTEAIKRAMDDVHRAVEAARQSNKPMFAMPPGYDLKAVGLDPAKGQMIEARRFQVMEIARAFQLPPVFLQDLENATFTNSEQQDLHLVKHLIGQWAAAFEGEFNLKVFGNSGGKKYVEHNLDGLMRGDFKSRIEALALATHSAQITPNEGRALENRPALPGGDDLLIQGATVPLGSQPVLAKSDDTNGAKA